jgi:biotin synthase
MTDENALLAKALARAPLTRAETAALLSVKNPGRSFEAADRVRKAFVGDGVYLRGLIEFSNYCKNDCLYCGIRRSNASARRYRLTPEEIVHTAKKAAGYGYKTVVLQSGEDPWFDADTMADIIRQIKTLDVAVTLSLGEKTREEY